MQKHPVRIGTSNIVLPGNKQSFPGEFRNRPRLSYYATLFNTLEVNSSFYKIPQPKTFAKWATEVPEHFRFTVKLWKGITHVKHLDYRKEDVTGFMKACNETGNRKGCLLVQFPASITPFYIEKVTDLLQLLRETDPENSWQLVTEFRDTGWYTPRLYQTLDKLQCAVVLHDMKQSGTMDLNKGARVAYLRLHGPEPNYSGSYTMEQLEMMATSIHHWRNQQMEVYAYFNNTLGAAFENARQLAQLVAARP